MNEEPPATIEERVANLEMQAAKQSEDFKKFAFATASNIAAQAKTNRKQLEVLGRAVAGVYEDVALMFEELIKHAPGFVPNSSVDEVKERLAQRFEFWSAVDSWPDPTVSACEQLEAAIEERSCREIGPDGNEDADPTQDHPGTPADGTGPDPDRE